jgi:eukaryotic-like serine/threonine-protein kinase
MTDLLARLRAALGDRYTVERELGAGGMGRVFVALERALDRRVAVKVLPPELAAAVSVERFRREIQLAASLQHPHIVPLLSAGEAGGLFYYTMPFIDGETLRSRLTRDGRLPVPDAVRILRDVLDALAYAHRRGVVHRDIKPENVLLVEEHALVTDFGVAKALTQASGAGGSITSAGIAIGTPAYMAPEQAAGDPQVDHRSDVYAAGVLAYEMLGGQTPFGGSVQRVLAAQVMDRPAPMARLRPEVPPALASSVMRCLEKDPAKRWQTADDLRRDLERTPTGGGGSAGMVTGSGQRRWRAAAAGLLLAGVLGGGWAAWRARTRGPAVASPTLVAVLPFAVRGSADAVYLGEGMVSLLSTSLDGAGELRAVDPHAVLSVVQRRGRALLDPASAAVVAERLGAGLYVLGDVVEAGGQVQITASLFDREHRASPLARGTVEGSGGQVFALVDGLATQLLAGKSSGPKGRVTRVASVTTSSLAAYKAYLDGEAAFRAGRADSAVVAFERAVRLDPSFALAYYRLSVAAEWATLAGSFTARAAEQAVRHSARLTDHDRLLLRALLATRRGAAVEAEGLYRNILGTYPDDIEAWSQLGEVLFHYGPEQGRNIAESRAPFERVLYFDPAFVSSLVHLARIAAVERRGRDVDSIVGLIDKLSPSSDRDLEMRVLRAYALGDVPAQQRVLAELGRASDATLVLPVWDIGVFVGDLDGAEAIARLLADPTRSVDARAAGHASLAYLALARGKLGAARAELTRAAAADPVRALEYGTLLELSPFLDPPRPVLERARRALDRVAAGTVPPTGQSTVYFSVHDGIHRVLCTYLLGLVSARLGDVAAGERYAASLISETGSPAAATLPRDLGLEVRADVAIGQGAPASALALLRQTTGESWYEYHFASPFLAGSRERYRRAGLEAGQGDARRAIALYSGFEGFSGYALAYAAPSHLRRAELYERLGDRSAAASHYTRFLTLWKDCDPQFRPLLDSARAGLARVKSPS